MLSLLFPSLLSLSSSGAVAAAASTASQSPGRAVPRILEESSTRTLRCTGRGCGRTLLLTFSPLCKHLVGLTWGAESIMPTTGFSLRTASDGLTTGFLRMRGNRVCVSAESGLLGAVAVVGERSSRVAGGSKCRVVVRTGREKLRLLLGWWSAFGDDGGMRLLKEVDATMLGLFFGGEQ